MMGGVKRALVLCLALAGCPDPGPATPGGVAAATSSTAATPTSAAGAADPLAGGVFTREEVLDLFRLEHAVGAAPSAAAAEVAEAARLRAFKQHRLVDDEGREVPARVRAYERAVQALAQDAEGWSAFVDSLERRPP